MYPLDLAAAGDGLVAHFLRLQGIDDTRLLTAAAGLPRRNTRHGAKYIEVRRLASVAAGPKRRSASGLARTAAFLRRDRLFAGLSGDAVEELAARFAESNARFARQYGIDKPGVLFETARRDVGRVEHIPTWAEFGSLERMLVRHHVWKCTGVDIDPGGSGNARGGAVVRALAGILLAVGALRVRANELRIGFAYARAAKL